MTLQLHYLEEKKMPKVSFNTREEWLKERQSGIGGSDIAAIMGVDEYKTALDVYLEKTEIKLKEFSDEQQANMDRGHILEKPLLEWLKNQNVVPDFKHNTDLYYDANQPIFKCTPDGEGEDLIVEAKSTRLFIDEVMPKWYVQGQWNLGVTNKSTLAIVWINGKLNFNYKLYHRDENLINNLKRVALDFWNLSVLSKTPPNPTNSKDISNLYKSHIEGKSTELTVEQYDFYNALTTIKSKIKNLEEQEEELTEKLKMIMMDSENLIYGGRVLATWKTSESNRIDSTMLKKVMPDVYNQFIKTSISRRFLLK